MGSAPSTARGRALVQARKAADDIGSRGVRGAVHGPHDPPEVAGRRTADGAVADRRSRGQAPGTRVSSVASGRQAMRTGV